MFKILKNFLKKNKNPVNQKATVKNYNKFQTVTF